MLSMTSGHEPSTTQPLCHEPGVLSSGAVSRLKSRVYVEGGIEFQFAAGYLLYKLYYNYEMLKTFQIASRLYKVEVKVEVEVSLINYLFDYGYYCDTISQKFPLDILQMVWYNGIVGRYLL